MDGHVETLVAQFLRHVADSPGRSAFIQGGQRITYAEAGERIARAARELSERGVAAGERVIISAANTPAAACAYYAVHAVGAIAVPVFSGITDEGLSFIAEDTSARLALLDRTVSAISTAVVDVDTLGAAGRSMTPVAVAGSDIADILYTSGTTGRRKGVVLTHGAILAAARHITSVVGQTSDDIELVPVPLTHSFGLGRLRCQALTGHCLVLEHGMRNGAVFLQRLSQTKATGLAIVPAGIELLFRLTGDAIRNAAGHLRYIELGSAAMRPETRQRLAELLPRTAIYHHYGLTEASRAAFCEYHRDAARPNSVGKPAPGVHIRIVDEAGREVPVGQRGEIVVRGEMLLREYWKQPELTASVLDAGGFHTGDLGHVDHEGYLYLDGRANDQINVGGFKLAPEEVERWLNAMPGVQESACIGVADPLQISGESVMAFIVSKAPCTLEDVVGWLRPKVEEYKIPRMVQRVRALPKTDSGKIQRQRLRTGDYEKL